MLNNKNEKPKYIEVEIGPTCAKDCLFCLEGGRGAKRRVVSFKDLKLILKKNKNLDKVVFSGGEPILNKDLFVYLEICVEHGIKNIGIVSAWEKNFGIGFAEKLLRSGVNEVMLSIEGPKNVHDKLTQKAGSYTEVAKAFRNFYRLKRIYNFRLTIHSNVNLLNYQFLPLFALKILQKYPHLDCYHFQMLEPIGKVLEYKEKILPKYREAIKPFDKYLGIYLVNFKEKVKFGLLPYCLIEKKFYPLLGRRADVVVNDVNGKYVFSPSSQDKTKFEKCKKCLMNIKCDGIWINYISIHGIDEFK